MGFHFKKKATPGYKRALKKSYKSLPSIYTTDMWRKRASKYKGKKYTRFY